MCIGAWGFNRRLKSGVFLECFAGGGGGVVKLRLLISYDRTCDFMCRCAALPTDQNADLVFCAVRGCLLAL